MAIIIKTIDQLERFLSDGTGCLGFVPTMGNLHSGHESLIQASVERNVRTIVSIFVNPTQFSETEDFGQYPRTLEADIKKIDQISKNIAVFTPDESLLYPSSQGIWVNPSEYLNQIACGQSRPSHFKGVLTVVMKLLQLVKPSHMYMGKKDYQQWTLVQKMAQNFFMDVSIQGVETVREDDGLAMSSRNQYLTKDQREAAPKLFQTLKDARKMWLESPNIEKVSLLAKEKLDLYFNVDYFEIINFAKLGESNSHSKDRFVALAAINLGATRLIDNIELF